MIAPSRFVRGGVFSGASLWSAWSRAPPSAQSADRALASPGLARGGGHVMANATAPAAPPTGVSQRGWYKRNEIAATPWLFLIPGILFFAVYVIFPIFQSVWISFHEWDGLGEMTWVGTANYERLLTDDRKFECRSGTMSLAVPLSAGDPGGAVHRAVPQSDRARHPHLQITVFLSRSCSARSWWAWCFPGSICRAKGC
jgi:hypothetical protein